MNTRILTYLFAIISASTVTCWAGTYSLSSCSCDGGGASCSGEKFRLSGTVGQPDAGTATGGAFSLDGGFWPGVQELGPSLRIEPYNGFVIVAWPASFTGFSLQESADLTRPQWSAVTTTPVEFDDEKLILLPATASARFYRLVKP